MNTFKEFWQAFFYGSYAKYEESQEPYKDRAAVVWSLMPESSRTACLSAIKAGDRYDKTPYVLYYLQHYKEPLRIWRSGDSDLTYELVRQCIMVRYKGSLHYCLPEDLERCKAAGAIEIKAV